MIILLTDGNFYVLTDFSMIALHHNSGSHVTEHISVRQVGQVLEYYFHVTHSISILHTNPERQLLSAYYEETNAQNN